MGTQTIKSNHARDAIEGIGLKVERANKHIEELTTIINEFGQAHPPNALVKDDVANGQVLIQVLGSKETPPAKIAVVAGEILYLQRSALDHLFTAAVTRCGHICIKRPNFPIEETRDKFEAALENREIQKRFPDVAAVLRWLEPYKRRDGLLWWLHWLNGAEKHQTLVTVAGSKNFREIKLSTTVTVPAGVTPAIDYVVEDRWFRYDESYELLRAPIGTKFDPQIQFEIGVAFRDIETIHFEPIQTTLVQFSDLVMAITDVFTSKGLIR